MYIFASGIGSQQTIGLTPQSFVAAGVKSDEVGCCCTKTSGVCSGSTTMFLPTNYQNTDFFGWFPQSENHTYRTPEVLARLNPPIEIYFNYAPDTNCMEAFSHPNGPGGVSEGSFRCFFDIYEDTYMYIRVEGPTEAQDAGFDISQIHGESAQWLPGDPISPYQTDPADTEWVGSEVKIYGFNYGRGCTMIETRHSKRIDLVRGRYYYHLSTRTIDGFYHPASYHKFTIKAWEGEPVGEVRPGG